MTFATTYSKHRTLIISSLATIALVMIARPREPRVSVPSPTLSIDTGELDIRSALPSREPAPIVRPYERLFERGASWTLPCQSGFRVNSNVSLNPAGEVRCHVDDVRTIRGVTISHVECTPDDHRYKYKLPPIEGWHAMTSAGWYPLGTSDPLRAVSRLDPRRPVIASQPVQRHWSREEPVDAHETYRTYGTEARDEDAWCSFESHNYKDGGNSRTFCLSRTRGVTRLVFENWYTYEACGDGPDVEWRRRSGTNEAIQRASVTTPTRTRRSHLN